METLNALTPPQPIAVGLAPNGSVSYLQRGQPSTPQAAADWGNWQAILSPEDPDGELIALHAFTLAISNEKSAVIGAVGIGTATARPETVTLAMGPLAVLLVCAIVCGLIAAQLKIGAAEFAGSMIAGLFLSGTGVIEGAVPFWLAWPAFIATGVVIGTRFARIDRAFLRESVVAGLMVFSLSAAITAGAAFVVASGLGQPFGKMWLAFAPGGLDTMAVLAFSLGHDPAFVAGHQLLRFLGLCLVLPFVLRRTLDA